LEGRGGRREYEEKEGGREGLRHGGRIQAMHIVWVLSVVECWLWGVQYSLLKPVCWGWRAELGGELRGEISMLKLVY
jgi:hypothetical protein